MEGKETNTSPYTVKYRMTVTSTELNKAAQRACRLGFLLKVLARR
jgi:hypothetical protein